MNDYVVDTDGSSDDEPQATRSYQRQAPVGQPRPASGVLYCLEAYQRGQANRTFYSEKAWTDTHQNTVGESLDQTAGSLAILLYSVGADVTDKTGKESNTARTWSAKPVDFELGRDAFVHNIHPPSITIYSKRITDTIRLVLDYYPEIPSYDYYNASPEGIFSPLMYCFAELKAYFQSFTSSLPTAEVPETSDLYVGDCGDEEIASARASRLDFGLLDMGKQPCDEATAHDLAVLLRFLAPMYQRQVVPSMSSLLLDTSPSISFESLWLLFRPGTYVYVLDELRSAREKLDKRHQRKEQDDMDDEPSAWVVSGWDYSRQPGRSAASGVKARKLLLDLWNIEYWNGSFRRTAKRVDIRHFEGQRPLWNLHVIPISQRDALDGGTIGDKLRSRGKKYLALLKEPGAHREYDRPFTIHHGQVIVDPDAYAQYQAMPGGTRPAIRPQAAAPMPPPPIRKSPFTIGGPSQRFDGLMDFDKRDSEEFERIDEVYVLLPPRIGGLSLRTKRWEEFDVEHISQHSPTPSPNQIDDQLVLVSDADKDSLRTVLPKGAKQLQLHSDFIAGKGEGKIFLLYGPPGTGKTLTVECVANDTGRPLLSLTAQDLGVSHTSESALQSWFALAAKWNAILLIDEADLFLEQRRQGDISRNSLSTVFLRTMEYYNGVLFLTTNRLGQIDDSFISRITCPIAYHELSSETKAKIIRKFAARFEETGVFVDRAAVQYLISNCEELNGRQIRNLMHTAAAPEGHLQGGTGGNAHMEAETTTAYRSIKIHHIKRAIDRQADFRDYLRSLRGKDEQGRARSKQDYLTLPNKDAIQR
ncbi:hypothetical protein CC79DRAFT_1266280 [Sarocladium strictum]